MVVVMANIGAGKTVLCKRLERIAQVLVSYKETRRTKLIVCHEPVSDWEKSGLLAEFYKDVVKPVGENNRTPFVFQVNAFSSRLAKIASAVRGTSIRVGVCLIC